jgi:protein gp37
MSDNTQIEWAEATINPIVGCSPCSPGCDNCYAARMAHRLGGNELTPQYNGLTTRFEERCNKGFINHPCGPHMVCYDCAGGGAPRFNGTIRFVPEVLEKLKHWRTPRRVFVCSMSDLFHEGVGDYARMEVFRAMAAARQHTYQLLTKRAEHLWWAFRQCEHCVTSPPPNWWWGVTACNQEEADKKIPHLLKVPAKVRWISAEPLLAPLDIMPYLPGDWWCPTCQAYLSGAQVTNDERHETCGTELSSGDIRWLVVGGETGPHARPVDPWWVVDLYRQCKAAGVPFFAKKFPHLSRPVDILSATEQADWYTALETREYPEVEA